MKTHPYPALSLRTNPSNPNHHLWNNNGTWYAAYTILTSSFTAERIRTSLKTKNLAEARKKRDELLRKIGHGSTSDLLTSCKPSCHSTHSRA